MDNSVAIFSQSDKCGICHANAEIVRDAARDKDLLYTFNKLLS